MLKLNRIVELIDENGTSEAKLCTDAGLGDSYIRLVRSGKNKSGGTLKAAQKLALVLGVEVTEIFDVGARSPTSPERKETAQATAEHIFIVGSVKAGAWSEEEEPQEMVSLGLAFPGIPTPQFAFKVEGKSMNRHALPGMYWVCHKYDDPNNDPVSGHFVVIERRKDQLLERTVKKLVIRANNTIEFWPDSYDERWQKPYIPDGSADETYSIVARARIVLSNSF